MLFFRPEQCVKYTCHTNLLDSSLLPLFLPTAPAHEWVYYSDSVYEYMKTTTIPYHFMLYWSQSWTKQCDKWGLIVQLFYFPNPATWDLMDEWIYVWDKALFEYAFLLKKKAKISPANNF